MSSTHDPRQAVGPERFAAGLPAPGARLLRRLEQRPGAIDRLRGLG